MKTPRDDLSTGALIKAALDVQREFGFELAYSFLLGKGIDSTLAIGLLESCKDHSAKWSALQMVD